MVIPKDAVMLLSFINLKLRDEYSSFDLLCEENQLEKEEIINKLREIDYEYDESVNQFI